MEKYRLKQTLRNFMRKIRMRISMRVLLCIFNKRCAVTLLDYLFMIHAITLFTFILFIQKASALKCSEVLSDGRTLQYQSPSLEIPNTHLQTVSGFQTHYYTISKAKEASSKVQIEVIEGAIKWLDSITPSRTYVSEPSQNVLLAMRVQLSTLLQEVRTMSPTSFQAIGQDFQEIGYHPYQK